MSYLVFTEVANEARKTKRWNVTSTSGSQLGEIAWFGRWRCYTFQPISDYGTVFNAGCLTDLARFCRDETLRHLESRRAR